MMEDGKSKAFIV